MSIERDRLDKLYDVADDYESATLDELQHRAHLVWTCPGPHQTGEPAVWTMAYGEPCKWCGKEMKQ